MAANIAPTSFGTQPDNTAVAVDVYGQPPLKPTNNLPSVNIPGIAGNEKLLNSFGKDLLKGMAKNYIQTGRPIDLKSEAMQKLVGSFKISKGDLQALGGRTLDAVLKGTGFYNTGIGKVVDGIAKNVTGNPLDNKNYMGLRDLSVMVNGARKVIKNIEDLDINSLTDLSNLIGSISGEKGFLQILNLTEVAGVLKGINDIAKAYQIPGVLDKLLEKHSGEDRKRILALVASGNEKSIDISSVDTMLNYMTGSELLNSNPFMIEMLLAGYGPSEQFTEPSKEAADYLLIRLNKINPHWHEKNIGGEKWVSYLPIFSHCSLFTRSSFIIADLYKPELALTGDYTGRTFVQHATRLYPFIGLGEKQA